MNIIIKPGVTIIIKRNVIALLIQTTVYVQALLISCLNLYVFWGSYLPIQLMLYQARAMLDHVPVIPICRLKPPWFSHAIL